MGFLLSAIVSRMMSQRWTQRITKKDRAQARVYSYFHDIFVEQAL